MRYRTCTAVALLAAAAPIISWGQSETAAHVAAPFGPPVDDQRIYGHALLDEFEYRAADGNGLSRWEGEAWIGTDTNRLWFKSEGDIDRHGKVKDGRQELLYDRPITSFFNIQSGLRYDLDSAAGRAWAALGVEGLAPYFLHVSATAYASDGGHFAARVEGSYDLLFTQRLILQPLVEANIYSKADPQRRLGSGVSDLDAGLRLRYEIRRKFAPYLGVGYQRTFAATAQYARIDRESVERWSVLIGVRSWL